MDDLIKFLKKDKQKKYLEIFLILDEISQKEDIISFTYKNKELLIQVSEKDYYRINLKEVENG